MTYWGILKRVVIDKEQPDLQLQSIPNVICLYDDKNYVGNDFLLITPNSITNINITRTISKSGSYERFYSSITVLIASTIS